jgi:hypothetical protein
VTFEEIDIPVTGGTLRVCRRPGSGPTVVAAHGITANALSRAPVADAVAAGVDRTRINVEPVPDVNHDTILVSPKGAATVADHIGRLS